MMSSMASTGLSLGLNLPLGSKVDGGGEAGNGNDDAAAAAAEERRLRIQIEQLQQQQQRVAAAAALKTAGENRMTCWICIIGCLI